MDRIECFAQYMYQFVFLNSALLTITKGGKFLLSITNRKVVTAYKIKKGFPSRMCVGASPDGVRSVDNRANY